MATYSGISSIHTHLPNRRGDTPTPSTYLKTYQMNTLHHSLINIHSNSNNNPLHNIYITTHHSTAHSVMACDNADFSDCDLATPPPSVADPSITTPTENFSEDLRCYEDSTIYTNRNHRISHSRLGRQRTTTHTLGHPTPRYRITKSLLERYLRHSRRNRNKPQLFQCTNSHGMVRN